MSSKTLRASVIIGGAISGSFRSAMSSAQSGLKAIGSEIAKIERQQREMARQPDFFKAMSDGAIKARMEYARLAEKAERLKKAQVGLARASERVEANRSARTEVGGQLKNSATTFGVIAGSLLFPAQQAAEFNRQNQLIGNTANMTRVQVAELSRTIMGASRDANQSASDVQRGIGFLVAAGLDAQRAQASIRTIGRTTTASGADIEDLAKASFTLIDALKIKPEGLQSALDILAFAGKQGNVELRDMAKTLPVLGSSFTALKMGGAEAAATLGAALQIARKGAADADEAANNMENFLAKILSPETLKKARKNFGLDLYAVIKEAQTNGGNPFEAAMQSIMRATAGDQKKIGELFGDMQVQNFLRPMQQNWDEYKRIKREALESSAGTTDRDFAKMMEQAGEQMRGLKHAAGRFGITFGTVVAPAIGEAASKMTAFLDTASGFVREHPGIVRGAVGAALAMSGLKVATLGARYAFLAVQSPFLKVGQLLAKFRATQAVAAAGGNVGGMGTALLRVGTIARTVGTAIAAIGGGPIAIAVAAITVGALVVRKYWEPIKAFMGGVFDGFVSAVKPAMDSVMKSLEPFKPAWDTVSKSIGDAWAEVVKFLEPVTLSEGEMSKVAKAGEIVGAVLSNSFTMGAKVIGGVIDTVVWFGEAIGTAAGWIVVNFENAWDKVKSVVGSAVDWIMGKIDKVMSAGSAVASALGFGSSPEAGSRPAGITPPRKPPGRVPVALRAVSAATISPRGGSSPSARAGASTVNDHRKYEIKLVQQPGEDSAAMARRMREEIRRLDAVEHGSRFAD
jgi:TP901 family phage tail tape measure protein